MIKELKQLLAQANSEYKYYYATKKEQNQNNEELPFGSKYVYIEEFNQGFFSIQNGFVNKTTRANIYFSKIVDLQTLTAEKREDVREEIEKEIIRPFINLYNKSDYFYPLTNFSFYQTLPQFNNGEVSIMLQFDCKEREKC